VRQHYYENYRDWLAVLITAALIIVLLCIAATALAFTWALWSSVL
jgi:hypothetical protein